MLSSILGRFYGLVCLFCDRYLWHQAPGLPFTFRDASFNIVDGSDQLEGAKGYSLVFVVDFHPNLRS